MHQLLQSAQKEYVLVGIEYGRIGAPHGTEVLCRRSQYERGPATEQASEAFLFCSQMDKHGKLQLHSQMW